jgi:hypothetical protein
MRLHITNAQKRVFIGNQDVKVRRPN